MKLIKTTLVAAAILLPSFGFAETMWKGEFMNTMPAKDGVTEEFCKQHALDTFEGDMKMIDKEVTGSNNVKAKNDSFKVRQMGGIYSVHGTATLSGEYEGKPWKEKATFMAYALTKEGMRHGVWYTKDCKGFYRVGPSNEM